MKTRSIKLNEVKSNKYVIDATGVRMGKLIASIAKILLKKHSVYGVRYIPIADEVYVINVNKMDYHPTKAGKLYYRHSMYPGGLKSERLDDMLEKKPEKLIERSVWGMLPKNRFGRRCLSQLHVVDATSELIKDAITVTV